MLSNIFVIVLTACALHMNSASNEQCPIDFTPITLNANHGLDFFTFNATDNCDDPLRALKGSGGKMKCTLDPDRGDMRAAGLGINMPNHNALRISSLCFSVRNIERIFVVPGYFINGMDGPNVEIPVNKTRKWTKICIDPFPGPDYLIGGFIWIHFYVDNPNASRRVKVKDLKMKACVLDWYISVFHTCYEGYCSVCYTYDIPTVDGWFYSTHGCDHTELFYYQK